MDKSTELVVDVARRVANGVEIRYCVQHEGRMPYGATRCQGYFSTVGEDSSCNASDYLLVDAALGITTEDDDGIHDWCVPERGLHGSQCTVPETIRKGDHRYHHGGRPNGN